MSETRAQIVAERVAQTGIDEAMIHRLVHSFYGAVRADPLLGPIFESKVDDWPAHLAKLVDFWSSIALMTGRFSGRPMAAHAPLPIQATHFSRWLELFRATAREVCTPAAADFFIARAEQIAKSFQVNLELLSGGPPRPASRPPRQTVRFEA